MKTNPSLRIANGEPLPRQELLQLLFSALKLGEYRYIRRAAEQWLETYPGDLEMQLFQARSLIGDKLYDQALPILETLCLADPEYASAQRLRAKVASVMEEASAPDAWACVVALGGNVETDSNTAQWGAMLLKASQALEEQGKALDAEKLIQGALLAKPPSPLASIIHIKLARQHYDWLATRNLAELYLKNWPDCVALNLAMADLLTESDEDQLAVALLHECVANDVTGQVAQRWWGKTNPYNALWPKQLQAVIDIPIPAAVASDLGLNQLAGGAPKRQATQAPKQASKPPRPAKKKLPPTPKSESVTEILRNVQSELDRVTDNVLQATQTEDLYPVYVVLTTHQGLEEQYGAENMPQIDGVLQKLVASSLTWQHWTALLLYADDPESTGQYSLKAADAQDPWSIKTLLADLDEALRERGQMIGALLIVGGPEVVPFHRLPNPVDDDDDDVPSDNPYATTDENYFVPSWPVGRVPGGANADPTLLIKNLEAIIKARSIPTKATSPFNSFLNWLEKLLEWLRLRRYPYPSLGYSAEIWQRASHSVYHPIGEPNGLAISPPINAEVFPSKVARPVDLSYFNLHGLPDTAEWYGQRDPLETPEGVDYPIALRPKDVTNSGTAPKVVFTEACYGGHIVGKDAESALTLKFLASGSQAVVGSTCTSYGSVTTPLIAADLLGKAFWNSLKDGHPVGEALRRAKILMAREMTRRQGYLDGEDQKTLISFVLYGDPLGQPLENGYSTKAIRRDQGNGTQIKAVCDRGNGPCEPREVPAEVMQHVKKAVEAYLPGMRNAQFSYRQERVQAGAKSAPPQPSGRKVVTLSKRVVHANRSHSHYAHITLNSKGKVVKLAVSR